MEMQPITLTRLIDKLCDNGWIERRGDEKDRRVNRLYLRKAARPLLGKLAGRFPNYRDRAGRHQPADAHRLLAQLDLIKENVRNAIQHRRTNLRERNSAMADPVLKFPPEQKGNPAPPSSGRNSRPSHARRLMAGMRRYRRFLLLVVLPLVALVAGVTFYLNGGRYVTTDDAYVGRRRF